MIMNKTDDKDKEKNEFIESIKHNTFISYFSGKYLNEPIIEIPSIGETIFVTPLFYACRYNQSSLLKKLLGCYNIEVNSFCIINTYKGARKVTPLSVACTFQHLDCIKLMLAHPKIDVNLGIVKQYYNRALYHSSPLLSCCKYYKKSLFDPNKRNRVSYTDLKPFTECVKLLLEHPKIAINKGDGHKTESPLQISISTRKEDLVILLLEKKAKIPKEYMKLFEGWGPYRNWNKIIPLLPFSNIVCQEFIECKNITEPIKIYLRHHSKICNLTKIEGRNRILCNSSDNDSTTNQLFIDLVIEKTAPKLFKKLKSELVSKEAVELVSHQLLYNQSDEIQNVEQCIEVLFLVYDTEMWNITKDTALNYLLNQFDDIGDTYQRREKINMLIKEHDTDSKRDSSLLINSLYKYEPSSIVPLYENVHTTILPQFYNNPESYPDIEIEFECGKKLQCHKSVLTASVPFFESYFKGDWKIEPLPDETEFIIYYCYHNSITSEPSFNFSTLTTDRLISNMVKSDEYLWDELTKVIGNYVIIDQYNFWEILDMVELYLESEGFRPILKYLALIACVYKKVLLVEGKREKLPKILMGEIISCFSNDFNF